MGVNYLHEFIEKRNSNVPNGDKKIDLIQLARTLTKDIPPHQRKLPNSPKLSLVVDGESCLNRLYGGYFSDWVCGGQWNRMKGFINDLVTKLDESNIEIVVFFNGAIEPQRMNEWIANQKDDNGKIRRILNHVNSKHTPPPKVWWTPPAGVRMAIRMMLRHMNVNVVSTIYDHRQEVIAYCRENNFHGLIADDPEYIAFNPPRLYSAIHLKLTYRGTLETKEYMISDLMQELELSNEKLCVLAALLGNYLLPESQLSDVHVKAGIDKNQTNADEIVLKLSQYVNQFNVSTDLDAVVQQIFGCDNDSRASNLKQSIQYYLNGTKDGFLRYYPVSSGKPDKAENVDAVPEPDLDTTALASEKGDTNKSIILNAYAEPSECSDNNEQEDTKNSNPDQVDEGSSCEAESIIENASSGSKKLIMKKEKPAPILPQVSHDVMTTLSERHSKGLMSPYIYQILSQGEIKLPVVMEDGNEIPNIYNFYRPIRQMVYAIVFNLHHHKFMASKEKKTLDADIRIKEWIFNKIEKVHKPEYVRAEPVGWGVPTIQRLWFGTLQDDRRRRLRAFLTCMRSDVMLILNPEYVPQQLLIAAVVLRYIMSFPDKKILRKQELDAFIVTALAPELVDAQLTQELKDPIASRGVQLAALFMKGVEMALLVNDACGAPIPWLMCCPWLFFDGKLFHHMFQKAIVSKNLQELCDNRLGIHVRTEHMRQAILEGLNIQFARPPIPSLIANADPNAVFSQRGFMNRMRGSPTTSVASSNSSRAGPEGGRRGRSMGGRLEVAGVVVGSWGANYNMAQQQPYETAQYMMSQHQYGKKKIIKKDRKPGKGRGMTIGSPTVDMNDSDLLNGNDSNDTNTTEEEKLENTVVVNGGGAVGFLGEGDGPASLKSLCETASSFVETVTE